jgi:hypothetical protein
VRSRLVRVGWAAKMVEVNKATAGAYVYIFFFDNIRIYIHEEGMV